MPERSQQRPSPSDMPRRQFGAPSPMDTEPTVPIEFRDDQSAAEVIEELGVGQTGEQNHSESPFIAYADGLDLAPLKQKEKGFSTVDTLHNLLQHAPDKRSDIVDVIAKIRDEKLYGQGRKTLIRTYEEPLIELGMSEYSRQYEQAKLHGDTLAVDDDPVGKARSIREGLGRAIADETDAMKKSKLEEKAAAIDGFIGRSDNDELREQANRLWENAASTYYDAAKANYPNRPTDAIQDARKDVLQLEAINTQDAVALEYIASHLKHVETPADDAEQPEAESVKARLAEIERELGLLYAKREEVALFDVEKNSHAYKMLREEYAAKSRELFMIENAELLNDPNANYTDVLKKMNEAVFASGRKLEDQKLEQDGRSRFKKTIHSIGRWMRKHPILAGAASATATVLVAAGTGGAASGLVAGTLAYIRAEDRHQEVKAKRERLFDDNSLPNYDLDSAREAEILNGRSAADLTEDQIEWLIDKRLNQNRELFEKRVSREKRRRLGSIGIGLAVGGGIFAITHGFLGMDAFGNHHDGSGAHGLSPETPSPEAPAPGEPIGPGDAPHPPIDVPTPTHEFAPGTFHANHGDGFYQILKNMGVEASQRDEVLAKASKDLLKQGFAYKMEDGLPGIPRPGNLPQGAIDILIKAAGK